MAIQNINYNFAVVGALLCLQTTDTLISCKDYNGTITINSKML